MTIPCKHRVHLLKDGELYWDQECEMRDHLRNCEACRAEYNDIQNLSRVLGALEDVDVRPEFDRSFWKKVEEHKNRRQRLFFWKHTSIDWRMAFAAPLLAGILMASGLYVSVRTVGLPMEDVTLSDQMELLADYDVINNLDLLESMVSNDPAKDTF